MKFDIEKINAISILDVAADLGMTLKRKGSTYVTLCPWHADHHPSLTLYSRTGENRCHCFSCGQGGSVIDLVMQSQGWDFKTACQWLSDHYAVAMINEQGQACHSFTKPQLPALKSQPKPLPTPICTIDPQYVARCHSRQSQFMNWMVRVLGDTPELAHSFDLYNLGATRYGQVIFWQIDGQGRVRSGKVMYYSPDGHRIGVPNWVHALYKKQVNLDEGWKLTQCFFGEHLLNQHPEATVMVVEAEKTAVFMSCLHPQHIWLASGGCENLTENKISALKSRKVVFFPDSGKYKEWDQKLKAMPEAREMKYSIDDQLESYPQNTDLVDVFMANHPGSPIYS